MHSEQSQHIDPSLPIKPRILVVDDDSSFRTIVSKLLDFKGFTVVEAGGVSEALRLIASESFDALLSDLDMPAPGDGLTVVSAMRHSHPHAVTVILSAFPEMTEAARAILNQVDEILLKSSGFDELMATLDDCIQRGPVPVRIVEDVASILERQTSATIEEWLGYIERDPLITVVPLDRYARCAHLPRLLQNLVFRLRHPLPLGRAALISTSAAEHGRVRHKQGYTAAMLIEESRMLQVSIFQTLENNLHKVDFTRLLNGVMAIADEVDAQLAQQIASFLAQPLTGHKPAGESSTPEDSETAIFDPRPFAWKEQEQQEREPETSTNIQSSHPESTAA
jgi:DNA-binding NarL/FixJ family response regulator